MGTATAAMGTAPNLISPGDGHKHESSVGRPRRVQRSCAASRSENSRLPRKLADVLHAFPSVLLAPPCPQVRAPASSNPVPFEPAESKPQALGTTASALFVK